jgi:peptidyl-Lys metalloendopeptidase
MTLRMRGIAVLLGVLCAGSALAGGNPLVVQMSTLATKASPGETVLWQVTNTSDEAVLVLRWETPLYGLSRSLFDVRSKGREVPYVDAVVHWGHPEAKDFIRIEPGQTLSAEVNLAASYAMSKAGRYDVSYDAQLTYVLEEAEKGAHIEDLGQWQMDSDAVGLYTMGRSASYYQNLGRPVGPVDFNKAAAYANCSSSQQTSVGNAHTAARTYAANSASYLNAGTAGPRYTTWFGAYNATRYSTVRDHFNKIKDALDNKTTTYNCACASAYQSAFAYVYPTQPYQIYLCGAFWAANNTGTDSRAGTIVHEQSHFNVNGGTNDYAYGQTNAKRLAQSNPKRAIQNADNHEYFAENTPAQN